LVKMPTLARNLIDATAVSTIADWINSLPGTPALAPPTISPDGAYFNQSVLVTLQHDDTSATLRYTLDGSLPTTNSLIYTVPFTWPTSATVKEKVFKGVYSEGVETTVVFVLNPPPVVSLQSPADGAIFAAPVDITIQANATDSDGVSAVEFFQGATKLGEATN